MPTAQPQLVSVIIPTFNRAGMVEKTVESALNQDYPHKQIIVVDDGSTDDTAERMKRFPSVEYYQQSNRRQAAARNTGLGKARGEFIASLDSDDIWQPNFLSESVAAMMRTNSSLTFASCIMADKPDTSWYEQLDYMRSYMQQPTGHWFALTAAQTRALFLRYCPAPSSATVIRRSAIKNGWNEQTRISDDWLLWLDAIFNCHIASAFTLQPLWIKRLDGANICDHHADKTKLANNELVDSQLILKHYGHLLTPSEKKLISHRMAASFFDLGYAESKQGERRKARKYYWQSFQLQPAMKPCLAAMKAWLKFDQPRPSPEKPGRGEMK